MQVTLEIPDSLADAFTAAGQTPARAALEALAVEGYRTGTLYEGDIRTLLGYQTPMEVHTLLQQHGVPLDYTEEDLEQDLETLRGLEAITTPSAA
jgi:predicted HTH domain antitoxin